MKPTKQSELDQPPSVCPRAQSNSNPPGFDKMLDFKTNLLGYFFKQENVNLAAVFFNPRTK